MSVCIAPSASQAVGIEALKISETEAEVRRDYIAAPLTGAAYRHALASLIDATTGASSPNWDGYGASPVNLISVGHALRLLTRIPPDIPAADINVDPDGEISIEWYREAGQVFSVSVSPSGKLSYAGMFGRSSVYGTEEFSADYLPVAIRANLRRLFSFERGL
jgi:hypothetical protein